MLQKQAWSAWKNDELEFKCEIVDREKRKAAFSRQKSHKTFVIEVMKEHDRFKHTQFGFLYENWNVKLEV